MKKKIAVIVPGGVGGGLFNQGVPALMNLINGLAREFDLTVFSMVTIDKDFEPIRYKMKSIYAKHGRWSLMRTVRMIFMIWKMHRIEQYDLFHGFWGLPTSFMAVFLGRLLGKPSIVSLQGGETASIKKIAYGHLRSRIKKLWLFLTLKKANHVTALTQFQVNELKKHGFKNKEIQVIPYGVDTDIFLPKEKEYEEPIQFIHIANLTAVKDQATLLKAFKIICSKINCHLAIIGNDFYNGKIQTVCKQLKLEEDVTFLGAIPNMELPKQLAKSHVMLHTSLYEAQGVVVAEAAACKVLVCGTKTGLIADLENETVAVGVGDYKQLADKVLSVLNDKEKCVSYIEKAYDWSRKYNIECTVQTFKRIYSRLLDRVSDQQL